MRFRAVDCQSGHDPFVLAFSGALAGASEGWGRFADKNEAAGAAVAAGVAGE
jgi:hypothetical protein